MLRLTSVAFAALLLLPAAAVAHGIGGEASDLSTLGFVPLGIEHMLLGWDHLLFILGVVLLAGEFNRAAKLITTFIVGHSLTLMLASTMDWRVSPTAVDVVIALSVVVVGVIGLRGRPTNWTPVYAMVGGFGLVHGFGLGTRLLDLGLPDDGVVGKVIAFNVGLEIGQLLAIAVVVGLLMLLGRLFDGDRAPVRRTAYGVIAAVGLVAAVVIGVSGSDGSTGSERASDDAEETASASGEAACVQTDEQTQGGFSGGHPKRLFYGPGEPAPEEDFAHVVGDGYVIIRYSDSLEPGQVEQLRQMVEANGEALVSGEAPGQAEPVIVTTAFRKLTCSRFDQPAIQAFADTWLADLASGRFG